MLVPMSMSMSMSERVSQDMPDALMNSVGPADTLSEGKRYLSTSASIAIRIQDEVRNHHE